MSISRRQFLHTGLQGAAAAALFGSQSATAAQSAGNAADWPSHPLRLVVPYPAGGNSDNIGRFLAERLGQALGQPMIVENRGGAGATIGTQVAANAAPDGYTLLLAPTAVMCITPHLRKVPYDPTAFVPVAEVSASYGLAVARKDLPANDFKAFVELAKKNPDQLTFGSAGSATITHLTGELVNLRAGIRTRHIPYKGSAPALTDLIGGQIDLIYDSIALPAIKAGQVKALAATGKFRHPELPDVPTAAELGYELGASSWFGLFAPAGTPRAIVDRIAPEVGKALAEPGVKEKLEAFSQYPDFKGPDEFAKAVANDSKMYGELIAQLGIKAE